MGVLDFILRGPEKKEPKEEEASKSSDAKKEEPKQESVFGQGGYVSQFSLLKKVRGNTAFPYEHSRFRNEMQEIEKEVFGTNNNFMHNKQNIERVIRGLKEKVRTSGISENKRAAIMDYIKILETLNN